MCPHWFGAACFIPVRAPPPRPPQPYHCLSKIHIFFTCCDDWHSSKMRGSETNSYDSIGRAVWEWSIDHLVGQKWASQNHFLLGGIWVAASGVEAEGGTGYRMVEAACRRWCEEWGMRLYSQMVMDGRVCGGGWLVGGICYGHFCCVERKPKHQ